MASRSYRSPSLAFPQERCSTLSHCVAKSLAQLNGWGRTWIWVERTGFQNAFDIFRNEPSSERFRCPSPLNMIVTSWLPANAKSPLSPSAGSLRAAASFRLSTARRADRTDRLAGAFPQERRPTPVALRGKATCATERVGGELGYCSRLDQCGC